MPDDQFLQDYIKQLMEREYSLDEPDPLTDDQLKEIALNTGMTDSDWDDLLVDAKNAESRGYSHLDRGNFEDAITMFNESIQLYPNSPEACYGMASALFKKAVEKEDNVFLEEALKYVERSLRLYPTYKDSLDLQGYIRKYQGNLDTKIVTKGRVNQWKKYLIPGIPALIILFWIIGTYNSVSSLDEDVESSWSQVENVCQARYDKITQLVKVVKSATKQENKILKEVIEARNQATQIDLSNLSSENLSEFAISQEKITESLGRLIAISEQYPKLKSMENYLSLQDEIAGSENRITVERRRFNKAVSAYNKKVKRFPTVLLPFQEKPYYEVPKGKLEQPNLDL